MSESGVLNAETAARIDLAAQSERHQESTLIMLCGWPYRSDCEIAIADAMREYLIAKHPKLSHKSICQRLSRDTIGDAIFCRIYLDTTTSSLANYLVNVVTSDYHVERSRVIFEFVFGGSCPVSVEGAPGFEHDWSAAKEADSLSAFRTTFKNALPGDLESIFSALRNNHPFYNGEIYPRIRSYSDVVEALTNGADSQ